MKDSIARDPHLTDALSSDYAALQNDLEQARVLAGEYQRELSDKTNDLALLKIVLERTSTDLKNLQANIVALRQERHRLANRAMHAIAFESKLRVVLEERDRLKLENHELREALECARPAAPSSATGSSRPSEGQPTTFDSNSKEHIDISFGNRDEDLLIYPSAQEIHLKKRPGSK